MSSHRGDLMLAMIPVLTDNYIYVLSSQQTGEVGVIDPAVSDEVELFLDSRGMTLTHVFNTHHHGDHTGGNLSLKRRYGATIVGARSDAHRIPGIDIELGDGDDYNFGGSVAKVLFVPGHTLGHIAFYFAKDGLLFCGDTLFSMGCGRLFEGSPDDMWQSLQRLRRLPDDTQVCCAHEYTEANIRFALTIDHENVVLSEAQKAASRKRSQAEPTVPSKLGIEKMANPFLRADDVEIKKRLGMADQSDVAVFAELRRRKDHFRG